MICNKIFQLQRHSGGDQRSIFFKTQLVCLFPCIFKVTRSTLELVSSRYNLLLI